MRAVFTETVKDKRSSYNYTKGKLQVNKAKLEESFNIPVQINKTVPHLNSSTTNNRAEQPSFTQQYSKEETREVTAFAQMYLLQLEKQLNQLEVLNRTNPLMTYEFFQGSLQLLRSSIKTIQEFIKSKNITELKKYLDNSDTNEVR